MSGRTHQRSPLPVIPAAEPPTNAHDGRLTSRLGVLGWSHLDPLLLAALALEAPVLLVGEHGTAKTLLVERVARAIDAEFRHYNASLLNYDDLVGIPLPGDDGGLRFVGTSGAVWDAEFAFFDEVNRCRADLQNKLFPIVHERRVAGQDLPRLRHRWAAMNPPSPEGELGAYLGAEPLDAALADRFWFVVRVPGWADLGQADRLALATGGGGEPVAGAWLPELVDLVAAHAADTGAALSGQLALWAVALADQLRNHGLEISPRRVRILVRAAGATHAAARLLGAPGGLSDHLELAVLNALPAWADAEPPKTVAVISAHVQAWELAVGSGDPALREVLAEPDPVARISKGLTLSIAEEQLSRTVTAAIAAQPTAAHRTALAVVVSRALDTHPLTPAAWGLVAELAAPALRPATYDDKVSPGRLEQWRTLSAGIAAPPRSWRMADGGETRPSSALLQAVVHSIPAADLEGGDDSLLGTLHRWCQTFGVTG